MRIVALLALVAAAHALPAHPVVSLPARSAGTKMHLRGGAGADPAQLLPFTGGLFAAQGALSTASPHATMKAYMSDIEVDDKTAFCLTIYGVNVLQLGILMLSVHLGEGIEKGTAYALAAAVLVLLKELNGSVPKIGMKAAPFWMWTAVATATAVLVYKGGMGIAEPDTLINVWSAMLIVNGAATILLGEKFTSQGYGMTIDNDVQKWAVRLCGQSQVQLALYWQVYRKNPVQALGAVWAFAIYIAGQMIVEGDWKTLRMPNAVPHMVWVALGVFGAYSCFTA